MGEVVGVLLFPIMNSRAGVQIREHDGRANWLSAELLAVDRGRFSQLFRTKSNAQNSLFGLLF